MDLVSPPGSGFDTYAGVNRVVVRDRGRQDIRLLEAERMDSNITGRRVAKVNAVKAFMMVTPADVRVVRRVGRPQGAIASVNQNCGVGEA